MDASKLATKMLEWEALREQLDALEAEIKNAVLEIGKTQTVGNVRATYKNGRKSYDYRIVGETAPPSLVEIYTKRVVDWRAVCKDERSGIEEVPFTQGSPSVSMKLLK